MTSKRLILFLLLTTTFVLQGCSGTRNMAGDKGSKEYNQDFESIKKVVERAIKASNMSISFVNDEGDKMILIVARDTYVGNEKVQQEQGEVRVIKKDEETTIVQVENPDYHFSVPSHQKEDYQRIIYLRIDNILENN